mmetsp:Transcript_99951/g.280008  ORF Transcript_99951/g.280008 Transcript_99951/m.280008 type:complete len:262 (-) Transcript_99951:484-1269(-)
MEHGRAQLRPARHHREPAALDRQEEDEAAEAVVPQLPGPDRVPRQGLLLLLGAVLRDGRRLRDQRAADPQVDAGLQGVLAHDAAARRGRQDQDHVAGRAGVPHGAERALLAEDDLGADQRGEGAGGGALAEVVEHDQRDQHGAFRLRGQDPEVQVRRRDHGGVCHRPAEVLRPPQEVPHQQADAGEGPAVEPGPVHQDDRGEEAACEQPEEGGGGQGPREVQVSEVRRRQAAAHGLRVPPHHADRVAHQGAEGGARAHGEG